MFVKLKQKHKSTYFNIILNTIYEKNINLHVIHLTESYANV